MIAIDKGKPDLEVGYDANISGEKMRLGACLGNGQA
jgi:hypothetical protein